METKQWAPPSFLKANLELFTQVMPTLSASFGMEPIAKAPMSDLANVPGCA